MTHRPDTHEFFARATERRRRAFDKIAEGLTEALEFAQGTPTGAVVHQFRQCADCSREFMAPEGMQRCSSCQSARALRSQIRVVA